jgi:competence ComEA-like helix-hairpin-helix protein
VTLYTRHQLALLFTLLAAAGVGLAVREWRAAYPELAERLEQFDRVSVGRGGEGPGGLETPLAAEPAPLPRLTVRGPSLERGARLGSSAREHRDPRAETKVGVATPEHREPRLDLNAATVDELRQLPGVGLVLAARILETRHRHGGFSGLDDLRRVKGLGHAKLERLRPVVTLGD